MNSNLRTIFVDCLGIMLLPIARFCLRRSIKFQDFVEAAKGAFVRSAREEMQSLGLDQSVVRMSVMTGLQRPEVKRLSKGKQVEKESLNPAARVIGQWGQDNRFLDRRGRPRTLGIEGRKSEFSRLVRSVSTELNPYAMLFELERLGFVQKADGEARLLAAAYEPQGNLEEAFHLLANDTHSLILAVEQNVMGEANPPHMHARTEYDRIDAKALPQLRKWLLAFGKKIHTEARRKLSKYDTDYNPARKPGSARVVIGSFSLVEDKEALPSLKKGGK